MEKEKKENRLIAFYKKFNSEHKTLCEIIRFVIVGGIATVIDWLVMGIVLYIFDPGLYPHFYNVWIGDAQDPTTLATVVGTGMGFCVSLLANYLLSVLFVYEEKGNSKSAKGIILFALLSVGGLLLQMSGMYLGFGVLKINEWIVKVIMTLVVLVYNYLTRKFLIFRKSQSSGAELAENPKKSSDEIRDEK